MKQIRQINHLIRQIGINKVAQAAGLNKSTISRYVNGEREYSLQNFEKVQNAIKELSASALRGRTSARMATERVRLGEDWRIAYFDFVDSFLATKSEMLMKERPVDGIDIKFLALICSIVMQLCAEHKIDPPEWAKLNLELERPWFVSKFKNLQAMSLIESPLYFKRNNIFVGNDFLKRA